MHQQTLERKDLLDKLIAFKTAWIDLATIDTDLMEEYQSKITVENPFDKTLPLQVYTPMYDWTSAMIKVLNDELFEVEQSLEAASKKIMQGPYEVNTGGGCMVSIIKFLDKDRNPRWLYLSDDSYSVTRVPYLLDDDYNEYEYSLDDVIIENGYIDTIETDNQYYWFVYMAERHYSR